jgi:hypothetical protein
MDDKYNAGRIVDENNLQISAVRSPPNHTIPAIPLIPRIRRPCPVQHMLGVLGRNTVFRNVLNVPRVPPKIEHVIY